MQTRRSVGFVRGFAAPFGALVSLSRLPRAWPLSLVPALLFLLLESTWILAAWRLLKPWVSAKLSGASALQQVGGTAAGWLSVALSAALGWLVSALLTPPLSAPALEGIVGLVERDLRAPARATLGFWAELGCGARSSLLSLAVMLPVLLGLTLLELALPPLAVVTSPLKLALGALSVAWALFDYPLTLRGLGARERLSFVSRNFSAVAGFGVAFSLVFWLPCCGIVMLPVGVAAATRLYWEIERA